MNILKKYELLKSQEKEPINFKELKTKLNYQEKEKLIDKILKSNEVDKIITKVLTYYKKISNQLFTKYNLKNDIKQGMFFTIVILILLLVYLLITTVFTIITFNSLVGLNLIFSLVKYTLFFFKWSYTIIKAKGGVITKYLANLFPNNQILNQEIKMTNKLPVFENDILMEIKNIINYLEINKFSPIFLNKIAINLQEITDMLDIYPTNFQDEIKSLAYKQEIIKKITIIKEMITKYEQEIALKNNLNLEKEELVIKIKRLNKKY